MTTMIDHVMPAWDFRERHSRLIAATPERAFLALPRVDLAHSALIGPLFRLRGLPALLRREAAPALRAGRLGDLLASGFVPLAAARPRGLVYGSVGQFWRTSGGIRRVTPEAFAGNREPGCARLAWSFEFSVRGDGCLASTETRIACNDRAAYRRMLAYWLLIRPASGIVRREILRLLARDSGAAP